MAMTSELVLPAPGAAPAMGRIDPRSIRANHTSAVDSDLSLVMARRGGMAIAHLSGVLDDSTVPELRSAFVELLTDPAHTFVLDMRNVRYVDSDGFGALLFLQRRLTDSGRRMALVGCQEAVRLALALTRLEILFPTYATLADVPTK